MPKALFSETKPGDPFTQPFRVALHQSSRPGEWVTHCQIQAPNDQSFFWGHYFDDYSKALEDYKERCNKYDLSPLLHQ